MLDFWKLLPHGTLLFGIFAMGLGAVLSLFAIPVIVRIGKAKSLGYDPGYHFEACKGKKSVYCRPESYSSPVSGCRLFTRQKHILHYLP